MVLRLQLGLHQMVLRLQLGLHQMVLVNRIRTRQRLALVPARRKSQRKVPVLELQN